MCLLTHLNYSALSCLHCVYFGCHLPENGIMQHIQDTGYTLGKNHISSTPCNLCLSAHEMYFSHW